MARVTADVHLAIGEFGVDLAHHDDHVPRDFLLRIIIAGEIALHVAGVALNAEGCSKGAHHGADFLRLEEFQVLRRLGSRSVRVCRVGRLLREHRDCDNKREQNAHGSHHNTTQRLYGNIRRLRFARSTEAHHPMRLERRPCR